MSIVNEKYVSDVPLLQKPVKRIGLKIKDRAITNPKIADKAVTTDKLADRSVDGRVLADDAVTEYKIADGAVEGRHIADGAITADKIAQGAIADLDSITEGAKQAINNVNSAIDRIEGKEITWDDNETAREEAELQRTQKWGSLKFDVEEATDKALEVSDNPTYVDGSGWIYEYDYSTHSYNKTEKNIRGKDFKIDKTFPSVAEMNAYSGDKLAEGNFFMVNTGNVEDEDTAKLYMVQYVNSVLKPVFLVDMSGARGFTGHTPQLGIGTVTTGQAGSSAKATLSPDGEDASGNPKFNLNFTIPKGDTFTFSDLTPADIEVLQQPAIEAASTAENKGTYAENQGDYAKEIADHPLYVSDGYIYYWDHSDSTYKKGEKVRGEDGRDLLWSDMDEEERNAIITEIIGHSGVYDVINSIGMDDNTGEVYLEYNN